MVFRLHGTPTRCPPPWSVTAIEGGDTPEAEEQSCACNTVVSGFECADSVNVLLFNTTGGCTGSIGTYSVPTTTGCSMQGAGGAVNSVVVSGVATVDATCDVEPQVLPLEPWAWQQSALVCHVPNTLATCDGGVCVPDAPGGFQLCVYQEGDRSCPMEYPNRELIFTDVEDTRTCTCGPSSAMALGTCGVEVSLHSNPNCSEPVGTATPTDCTSTLVPSTTVASMRATLDGTTSTTCSASVASSLGGVSGISPFTVCCAP